MCPCLRQDERRARFERPIPPGQRPVIPKAPASPEIGYKVSAHNGAPISWPRGPLVFPEISCCCVNRLLENVNDRSQPPESAKNGRSPPLSIPPDKDRPIR